METDSIGAEFLMNKYQKALDVFNEIVVRVNHYDSYTILKSDLDPLIESINTLEDCVKENFVYLFTHNGIRYAFRTLNQLYDFLNENKLSKVTIQSIQFYKGNEFDRSTDEV